VAEGPTLHVFESGPRIGDLRARLARLGYDAPADDAEIAEVFDPGLERAVKTFQRDHGLIDDGVVGARTLAAVNAPVETRLAQVMVNLERLRWMDAPAPRRIVVNIPDYTATLYEGGETVWRSRVVVGKVEVTETPEFSGVMRYIVVNPTWHIPDSIAVRDFLPQLQRDSGVLARQNIRLLTRGGTEINPKLVDFTQYTPENFPFRIKQRPNDDNALGEVKFMFPNEFSVYMHDTPHRELFARDERAFSNGCIRLEKPVELAHVLLAGQVSDPEAAYADLRAGGRERRVDLERPIPVTITYRTVWFDAEGAARYRADVYGRDAAVFRALEASGATLPAAQG
jgi:murein L,D-transpeptidase YcbB/YkuD